MKLDTIHNDERGGIFSLTDDLINNEVAIFTTSKGFARGGCVHDINNEALCVISGKIDLFVEDRRYNPFGTIIIPKGMPHYYVALEDSVVMEWGATPEEKKNKHEETRKIVEEINETAHRMR